ncbi:hypothetical protein GCM10010873_16380 [Cypionkella aquatica]|uniref:Mor transcription activator domain-containing protein n=1 Tax=Cypionkella aquatica TaxID=1756042 RepID=A0AA37U385_9RHOB|nr:hypothetical protein [Cypionkella aquatica]GLS86664.1 hypothetical protein GCM10010873_16380 [Cypionkella aquatica]
MTQQLPVNVNALPMSLVDVAETLGMRVALALIQHFGGLEVKFPVAPKADHPVILALGETDALALCQFLSGNQIYVPHARAPKSVRADVMRMEARGMDRASIARALGVSTRHVRRVANSRDDKRQPDLFSE